MIIDKLVDRMGNSNPQIFRELKERLTTKNIAIAIIGAIAIQVLVLLWFNGQIPIPDLTPGYDGKIREVYSKYCNFSTKNYSYYGSEVCKLAGAGFAINWRLWWADVFICLSWILPMGLMLGSVYMLVADLVQEEKRGTLNFIRLSPQSTSKIFIGKIFGVPILLYLAAALLVPLHVFTGTMGGASLPLIATWYVGITSIWWLLSSAAVSYVLLGGIQAIVTTLAVSWPLWVPMLVINSYLSGTINNEIWLKENYVSLSWFWLPISNSAISFYLFGTVCCTIASYWVWQALERRYLNPTATVVSKSQSYLINLCWQVLVAGLVAKFITDEPSYSNDGAFVAFAVMDFLALLLVVPMLLPSKQAIQDWSRYRRERVTNKQRNFWQRELFSDLIFHDKSPALLAIAINIGMAMVLWLPISLIAFSKNVYGVRLLGGICLASSLILIYAAIAHLGLFLKVKKRNLWIAAMLCGAAILPMVAAFALSPMSTPTGLAAILLLFSPLLPVGILNLAGGTILATFVAQLAMFAFLAGQLQRQLKISGRSQTKELLAQS